MPIPPHRVTPLKKDWLKIYEPLVEHLKLQVRFNPKSKAVEIRTCELTTDASALQKAADYVKAFACGFECEVLAYIIGVMPYSYVLGLFGAPTLRRHVLGLF